MVLLRPRALPALTGRVRDFRTMPRGRGRLGGAGQRLGSAEPNLGFMIPKIANASRSLRTTCRFGRVSPPSNSNIRAMPNIAGDPATIQRGISGLGIAGGSLARVRTVSAEIATKLTADMSQIPENVGCRRPNFETVA